MGKTGRKIQTSEEMMPTYAVLWEKGTKHDFKSLGRQAAEQIRAAVETKLVHDPRQGKQLQGDFNPPLWSYRIGAYRVIYTFTETELVIWVVRVGHRKEVYRKL
jgi:mRNA interferase RelE/StbE